MYSVGPVSDTESAVGLALLTFSLQCQYLHGLLLSCSWIWRYYSINKAIVFPMHENNFSSKYNEQVSTEASKGCLERQRIGTGLLANLNSLSTDHALSILVVHHEVLKKAF